MTTSNYLFQSERLGFRNWIDTDVTPFAKMCADPVVMEHFPSTLTFAESEDLITRMQQMYDNQGYTYFATEILETGEFIGMIGLAYQTYETDFAPATDIGWRLKKSAWGYGYATEGARRCLQFGFKKKRLTSIFSICTIGNNKSENVMKKIGMQRMMEFNHPELRDFPAHERCVLYRI